MAHNSKMLPQMRLLALHVLIASWKLSEMRWRILCLCAGLLLGLCFSSGLAFCAWNSMRWFCQLNHTGPWVDLWNQIASNLYWLWLGILATEKSLMSLDAASLKCPSDWINCNAGIPSNLDIRWIMDLTSMQTTYCHQRHMATFLWFDTNQWLIFSILWLWLIFDCAACFLFPSVQRSWELLKMQLRRSPCEAQLPWNTMLVKHAGLNVMPCIRWWHLCLPANLSALNQLLPCKPWPVTVPRLDGV